MTDQPPSVSRPPVVLAATDLTARSAAVPARAAALARLLGADLVLAHVRDAPSALPRLLRRVPAETALDEAAQGLDPAPRLHLLDGPVEAALGDLARAEAAVLLVLGLHRPRRVLDLLRLTTMERIVLSAPAPVLIAHQAPDRVYTRVLAATQFDPASAAALAMAARIAPGAQLHAIHALDLPLGARNDLDAPAADARLTRAEMLRTAWLALPELPALTALPEIIPGGVHEVMDFRARELNADLIALGSHSGRDPGQLGNYTRDFLREPPTDLLVAKPA